MAQQRVGLATIQVRPTYPGIWLATADGSKRLTLPGETELRSSIGMVFADSGSEESLLIPDQSAGLRIVQRAGTNGFVLELYRSDSVQPAYRGELTEGGHLTIPASPDGLELVATTLPGLQVDVRHLPALWLVPLGILLAFVGAVAFLRRVVLHSYRLRRGLSITRSSCYNLTNPTSSLACVQALAPLSPPHDAGTNPSDETLPPTTSTNGCLSHLATN